MIPIIWNNDIESVVIRVIIEAVAIAELWAVLFVSGEFNSQLVWIVRKLVGESHARCDFKGWQFVPSELKETDRCLFIAYCDR